MSAPSFVRQRREQTWNFPSDSRYNRGNDKNAMWAAWHFD